MKEVQDNFFDEWSVYDQVLDHNYMRHDDIFADVQRFLAGRLDCRPFLLLDLGCGSARHLARALQGRSVGRYIGYDLSEVALAHAKENLASLNCAVELRQEICSRASGRPANDSTSSSRASLCITSAAPQNRNSFNWLTNGFTLTACCW